MCQEKGPEMAKRTGDGFRNGLLVAPLSGGQAAECRNMAHSHPCPCLRRGSSAASRQKDSAELVLPRSQPYVDVDQARNCRAGGAEREQHRRRHPWPRRTARLTGGKCPLQSTWTTRLSPTPAAAISSCAQSRGSSAAPCRQQHRHPVTFLHQEGGWFARVSYRVFPTTCSTPSAPRASTTSRAVPPLSRPAVSLSARPRQAHPYGIPGGWVGALVRRRPAGQTRRPPFGSCAREVLMDEIFFFRQVSSGWDENRRKQKPVILPTPKPRSGPFRTFGRPPHRLSSDYPLRRQSRHLQADDDVAAVTCCRSQRSLSSKLQPMLARPCTRNPCCDVQHADATHDSGSTASIRSKRPFQESTSRVVHASTPSWRGRAYTGRSQVTASIPSVIPPLSPPLLRLSPVAALE